MKGGLRIPTEKRELVSFAGQLVEQCRVSMGVRTSFYRLMNVITETGKFDGSKSLINLLYRHLARTAAHLFSPVELKLAVDFDNPYPQNILDRGVAAAKQLTRHWERKNIDTLFGRGTFEALKYGICLLKQWPQVEGVGDKEEITYHAKLVMPWQFGVYNEAENLIDRQSVLCESASITLPEVWRRIWHLPDAEKLYLRIKAHASVGSAQAEPTSFFHQVLSTSQLDTGLSGATRPGGLVQLTSDPNYSIMGPQIAVETVQIHELWVQDADAGDYTTIIMIDPDIIIAPYGKKSNLLGVEGMHPYSVIQPNEVTNWFWGRSELFDLSEPQVLLSTWTDDLKRLFGLQIDKILAFIGDTNVTDEDYAQFRNASYMNLPANGKVQDLTPAMPPNAMEMLRFLIETINTLSGFPGVMRGQGDEGVRAGTHANTLLKTASPTLRDRALLLERQCAVAADMTLALREAKDDKTYWTKAETQADIDNTKFILADLPADWRVSVDSHSSSPIFSDENAQLLFALRKGGDIDGEFLLDNLPLPNKEQAKASLAKRSKAEQEFKQKLIASRPDIADKLALKQVMGGKR